MTALLLSAYYTELLFYQINNGRDFEKRLSYIFLSQKVDFAVRDTNCGLFLIKCLQILPNFAYIWGVSLRLPDLACPIEVGRPYLHLLADH